IEIDVPVLFTPMVSDNIATPVTVLTFGVRNSDGTAVSDIPDPTSGLSPIRCLFRKPGDFKVILQVQDNALDWPVDENTAKNNPTSASFRKWERRLEVSFKVYSSRLDIRVLERSQQGR
ncbi:hypothetical protein HYY75_07610, partial [bacterium]|nr:hypothetical protein [bacterium]